MKETQLSICRFFVHEDDFESRVVDISSCNELLVRVDRAVQLFARFSNDEGHEDDGHDHLKSIQKKIDKWLLRLDTHTQEFQNYGKHPL